MSALSASKLACPKEGTVIKTSAGGTREFLGADGPICKTKINGRPSDLILGLWGAESSSARDATKALQALDLKSNRRYRFQQNGSTECPNCTWVNTVSVERTERIEVPAGAFDTYLIRWNHTNFRGYEHNVWIWYSPDVGYTVKRQLEFLRGNASNQQSWEATEVKLPN